MSGISEYTRVWVSGQALRLKRYVLSTPRRDVQTERHTSACGCDRGRSAYNKIDTVMETKKSFRAETSEIESRGLVTFHPQKWTVQCAYEVYLGLALFFASTWWDTARRSASQRCTRWRKYLTTNDIVPDGSVASSRNCNIVRWICERCPAATLWKVSVATRCLFDQSLPTAVYESLNRERESVVMYYSECVRLSLISIINDEKISKRHHLRKIDATKPENCGVCIYVNPIINSYKLLKIKFWKNTEKQINFNFPIV